MNLNKAAVLGYSGIQIKITSGGWLGAGFAQATWHHEGATVGCLDPDMPTLGKATQHSRGRTLSGLGLEGDQKHLASSDIGRSWRKGHQDSPGRKMV